MKWSKYITLLIIVLLLASTVWTINEYLSKTEQLKKAKQEYADATRENKIKQSEADKQLRENYGVIEKLRLSLEKIKSDYRSFQSASEETIDKLRVEASNKHYITKIEKEIEYITLPFVDYGNLKLELNFLRLENPMLLEWGEKWKMSHDQLRIKFNSCNVTLKKANVYIKKLEKKKRIPTLVYVIIGSLVGYILVK